MLYSVLLIPAMSLITRAHGAGVETGIPQWGRRASEVVYGAVGFSVAYALWGSVWLAVALALLSVAGLSTGHGNFYGMRGVNAKDDPEIIERIIRPVFLRFGGSVHTATYSWFAMGAKGLIIGAALFPFGLALGILWPFAYWLSWRLVRETHYAEYISGAFFGAIAACAIFASATSADIVRHDARFDVAYGYVVELLPLCCKMQSGIFLSEA